MKQFSYIELLAPAKNLECGIEAVRHGADAVYIGAEHFGARSAAGNSIEDIKQLCQYAHFYNVKVYVTVNTIIYDSELVQTEQLIWKLYEVGVDALIIQDMGITQLNLPPIALHASTQMDNRTPEKVKFLEDAGFEQVVLARELSLKEIEAIHNTTNVRLEAFVHGALCVSYSGQCYMSQAMCGRSANRGECAQCCRLTYDVADDDGQILVHNKYVLSLKDLNQSDELEGMLDAGITSLKIEGRLKDVNYVKNVTAYYRQQLNNIFKRRKDYKKASSGHCHYTFTPDIEKSFNRGFTNYFLNGRTADIWSPDTPKSMGEVVGHVKEVKHNYITVAGLTSFNNGDGLCFINKEGKLCGFRVNRTEANKLYPHEMPQIEPNTTLYRNYNQAFEQQLANDSAKRKLWIDAQLTEIPEGFTLKLTDEDGYSAKVLIEQEKQEAQKPQEENIKTQLSKTGNTPYELIKMNINFTNEWFIPISKLSEARREAIKMLTDCRNRGYHRSEQPLPNTHHRFITDKLAYTGNVANTKAREFYTKHEVKQVDEAFEITPADNAVLMQCRHCIRFMLGGCTKHNKPYKKFKEPLHLVHGNSRFLLSFDCNACEMKIIKEKC